MNKNHCTGIRVFLLIVLKMISQGESETCKWVEDSLSAGIATALYKKYPSYFEGYLNFDDLQTVNDFFKEQIGCADGCEYRKYLCSKADGLSLLIALSLNELN